MALNWLYILGLLIVWFGNFAQIHKTIKSKSADDISLVWVVALVVSIGMRSFRAIWSTYWVWGFTYIISFVIMIIFLGVVIYYRRRKK